LLVAKGSGGRQAFGGRRVVGPPPEKGMQFVIMQGERGSGTCMPPLFFGRVVHLFWRQALDAALFSPAGGLQIPLQKFIYPRGEI
jgi:hypothetical protein